MIALEKRKRAADDFMGAPLLNEYKQRFVFRRLYATLTGCILPPIHAPASHSTIIVFCQIVTFFIPWIGGILVYEIAGESGIAFGSLSNILLGGKSRSRARLIQKKL